MNRRHFLAQSVAGLSLLGGFSQYAQANLSKARILVIGAALAVQQLLNICACFLTIQPMSHY